MCRNHKHKKWVMITVGLLLSMVLSCGQSGPPMALLHNRVTFFLPGHWVLQKSEAGSGVAMLQLLIPYRHTAPNMPSANVALIARIVSEKISVGELANKVYQNRFKDVTVLSDMVDGSKWRTIVWRVKKGDAYLIMNRFGVDGGVGVEAIMAYPIPGQPDQEWVQQTVRDFNALCKSLKIDGRNTSRAEVKLSGIGPAQ